MTLSSRESGRFFAGKWWKRKRQLNKGKRIITKNVNGKETISKNKTMHIFTDLPKKSAQGGNWF